MPTLMQGSKAPCLPDWAKGRREQTRHPALLLCYSLPDVPCLLGPRTEAKLRAEHADSYVIGSGTFSKSVVYDRNISIPRSQTLRHKSAFWQRIISAGSLKLLFCISKAEKSYSKLFCCSTSSLRLTTLKTWPSLILERGVQDYPIITQQKMLYLNPVSTHLSLQPEHVAEGTGEHNHLGTRLPTNSSHAWGLPDPLGW